MIDPSTIGTGLGYAKQAFDLLHKVRELLDQKKPDMDAVKNHLRQFEQAAIQSQQTVYELQKNNLELQAKKASDLQQHIESDPNHQVQIADLRERVQSRRHQQESE